MVRISLFRQPHFLLVPLLQPTTPEICTSLIAYIVPCTGVKNFPFWFPLPCMQTSSGISTDCFSRKKRCPEESWMFSKILSVRTRLSRHLATLPSNINSGLRKMIFERLNLIFHLSNVKNARHLFKTRIYFKKNFWKQILGSLNCVNSSKSYTPCKINWLWS